MPRERNPIPSENPGSAFSRVPQEFCDGQRLRQILEGFKTIGSSYLIWLGGSLGARSQSIPMRPSGRTCPQGRQGQQTSLVKKSMLDGGPSCHATPQEVPNQQTASVPSQRCGAHALDGFFR